MNNQKLTDVEFFEQLEVLLKNAPDNLVYTINVMEDPKKQLSRQIISASGSPKDLCLSFKTAFDKSPELKEAIESAIRIHSMMNSKNGIKHILDEMMGGFGKEGLFEVFVKIVKENESKKNPCNSSFGPGH